MFSTQHSTATLFQEAPPTQKKETNVTGDKHCCVKMCVTPWSNVKLKRLKTELNLNYPECAITMFAVWRTATKTNPY